MTMTAVSIIRALQATDSRTEKEQIVLNAWMTGERDFFHGARLAYDILVTFGVKKVAEIVEEDASVVPSFNMAGFIALSDKLRNRSLTGNAARDAINEAALTANTEDWNEFYRRIILKDFRAGITESTINKMLEKLAKSDPEAAKYIIPVFSCQLAKDGAHEDHSAKITGVKMLDIKLDGVRLLTVVDKESKTVTQYTRNGKVNENFPKIRKAFELMMDDLPCSMVYDGEITGKSFQELMTQINRKSNKNEDDAKYALFDCLPLKDFQAGKCKMPQSDRHTVLTGFIPKFLELTGLASGSDGFIYVVPKQTVDLDTLEGKAAFQQFNKEAIAAGYEGIMIKDPDAPYITKRSAAWLKMKPFIEVSLTIINFEEGTGKNVGKLGAWLMHGVDDGKEILVSVGGGFTDAEREAFWKKRKDYLGFIGEVRADCFSLEQGETVYSLRFPRWKGFRGTVAGEKL